jgi:acyl carrier protein
MNSEEILEQVKSIIVEQLGVREDQVVEGARFVEDLSADSLDIVELIMQFEEKFGLKIPDDVVQEMSTVGDAVKYIGKELADKQA